MAKHHVVVQYMAAGLKCPLPPPPYQTPYQRQTPPRGRPPPQRKTPLDSMQHDWLVEDKEDKEELMNKEELITLLTPQGTSHCSCLEHCFLFVDGAAFRISGIWTHFLADLQGHGTGANPDPRTIFFFFFLLCQFFNTGVWDPEGLGPPSPKFWIHLDVGARLCVRPNHIVIHGLPLTADFVCTILFESPLGSKLEHSVA